MCSIKARNQETLNLDNSLSKNQYPDMFDTYEYESLEKMIVKDELPMSEIAEIFTDKTFYKWYKKKYLTNK